MSKLRRLATGRLQRRWQMSTAGMRAGWKTLGSQLLSSADKERGVAQSYLNHFVEELANLKGSVVKVAQMLAVYGEHFLPPAVCQALHRLEDQVTPLPWETIDAQLRRELGERYGELAVDPEPIGAASLAQVHRARRLQDGTELCLKVRYPGIEKALDGDLDDVLRLLKVSTMMLPGRDFSGVVEQLRSLLHHEVDYRAEVSNSKALAEKLRPYHRYRVPEIFDDYCSDGVIAMTFEQGHTLLSEEVTQLCAARRNALGGDMLKLMLLEVFELELLQSDPNFGNYLVRLGGDEQGREDQLILLDAGSLCAFPPEFFATVRQAIGQACAGNREELERAAVKLGFIPEAMPRQNRDDFVDVLLMAVEPLTYSAASPFADEQNRYLWGESKLLRRLAKQALGKALSRHFVAPPLEFNLLVRKLSGIFTLLSRWSVAVDSRRLSAPYTRCEAD